MATPDAGDAESVALIRPNSVTHHTDSGHRLIRIPVVATTASGLDVRLPADGAIAPPGPHMLFLLYHDRIPSEGHVLQLT